MTDVIEWLNGHLPQELQGLEDHVSISESHDHHDKGSSKGLGVHAAQRIPGGDTIVSVPMECLLTPFSVPKELHPRWQTDHWCIQVPGNCVPDSTEGYPIKLTHAGMTIFALLVECQKAPSNSFYGPYIRSLPERVPVLTSLPEAVRAEIGETTLGETLAKTLTHRILFFRNVVLPLWRMLRKNGLEIETPGLALIQWACDIYFSRALQIPGYAVDYLTRPAQTHGKSAKPKKRRLLDDDSADDAHVKSPDLPAALADYGNVAALVPLVDMINHCPHSTNRWNSRRHKNAIELVAGKTCNRASELVLNYGIQSNHDLALRFGFTLSDNTANIAHVVSDEEGKPKFMRGNILGNLYYARDIGLATLHSKTESLLNISEPTRATYEAKLQIQALISRLNNYKDEALDNTCFGINQRTIQMKHCDAWYHSGDHSVAVQTHDPRIDAIAEYLRGQIELIDKETTHKTCA